MFDFEKWLGIMHQNPSEIQQADLRTFQNVMMIAATLAKQETNLSFTSRPLSDVQMSATDLEAARTAPVEYAIYFACILLVCIEHALESDVTEEDITTIVEKIIPTHVVTDLIKINRAKQE
ncbi:MAG: hypothetical protein ABI425_04090 [Patescibacteria group bacterium]